MKNKSLMETEVQISMNMAQWNEIIQSIEDDDIAIMLVNEFPKKIRDSMGEFLKGTKPM